jgi:hypothetical protein
LDSLISTTGNHEPTYYTALVQPALPRLTLTASTARRTGPRTVLPTATRTYVQQGSGNVGDYAVPGLARRFLRRNARTNVVRCPGTEIR